MNNINYENLEIKIKQKVLVDVIDANNSAHFIRVYVYDKCGDLEKTFDTDLDGNNYVVQGTIEEKSNKVDFVDELKMNDRLKIDVIGSLDLQNNNALVYMGQNTEQSSIDNSGSVLQLDNGILNTSPTTIDVTTTLGEYVILVSGNYELELQITADTQDNARRTSKTTLQVFNGTTWEDVSGSSSCYGYHRNNASGENTVCNRVIVSAQENSRYRYLITTLNNGFIKTVPNGTSLVIKQI